MKNLQYLFDTYLPIYKSKKSEEVKIFIRDLFTLQKYVSEKQAKSIIKAQETGKFYFVNDIAKHGKSIVFETNKPIK